MLSPFPTFPNDTSAASRAEFNRQLKQWVADNPVTAEDSAAAWAGWREKVRTEFDNLPQPPPGVPEWTACDDPPDDGLPPVVLQTADQQREENCDFLWQWNRAWVELCTNDPRVSDQAKAEHYESEESRDWVWKELAYQARDGGDLPWVEGSIAAAMAEKMRPHFGPWWQEYQARGKAASEAPDGAKAGATPPPPGIAQDYGADQLEHMDLAPLAYLVAGLICAGVIALVGRPKIGKSWLALQIGNAVASRGTVLGQEIGTPGTVLFCGLEDSPRRMKSRMARQWGRPGYPPKLRFLHKLPMLDDGGIATLDEWCDRNPDATLIVLDTIGKCRGQRGRNEDPYAHDVRVIGMLQDLASRRNLSILLCHHQRKSDAEDVFDTVSGTLGFTGTVDSTLIVGKTEKGLRLVAQSRDNENEVDKLVAFDRATAQWRIIGEYESATRILNPLQKKIVAHLGLVGSGMPGEIADALGEPHGSVKSALWRMAKDDPPVVSKSERNARAYVIAKGTWNYDPFRDGLTIDGERIETVYKGE